MSDIDDDGMVSIILVFAFALIIGWSWSCTTYTKLGGNKIVTHKGEK